MLCCERFRAPVLPVLKRRFLLVPPRWPAERRTTPLYKRSVFTPPFPDHAWSKCRYQTNYMCFPPPSFAKIDVYLAKSLSDKLYLFQVSTGASVYSVCLCLQCKVTAVCAISQMSPVTVSRASGEHELRRRNSFDGQN